MSESVWGLVSGAEASARSLAKALWSQKGVQGASSAVVSETSRGWAAAMGRGSWMVRLAGASGAAAVALGAYGAHVVREKADVSDERKTAFEAASKYHLLHSVLMAATPLAAHPKLTATLLGIGILLFCGPCYHHAINDDPRFRKVVPIGGMVFIAAWMSLML